MPDGLMLFCATEIVAIVPTLADNALCVWEQFHISHAASPADPLTSARRAHNLRMTGRMVRSLSSISLTHILSVLTLPEVCLLL